MAKKKKPLVARYEIRVGKRTRGRKKSVLCDFGDKYTDIVVLDLKTKATLAWNIKDAKNEMGLKEDHYKVIPYLANILLTRMQETDFDKAK